MRRLSFILVLAIFVGGVPIWNAQASATPQTVHSSVLLAQAVVQPSSGFLSGIASAIDKFVSSVVETFKSALGIGESAKVEAPVTLPESLSKTDAKPATEPVSLFASVHEPVVASAKGTTPQPPSTTMQSQPTAALAAVLAPGTSAPAATPKAISETASETAKGGFSLFGKNTAQPVAPTVTKSLARDTRDTRDTLGLSKVETNAASKTSTSAVLQSAPAVQAPVASTQSATTTTSSTPSSPVSAASQYTPPVQATVAPSAPAARTEAAAASQPLMYSQPFVDVPARTVPSGPAVVRETPTRPTALVPTRPVVTATREPIVALPRFIDTFVPPTTRPVVAPASRVTIAEQTSTIATRETAAQPTSPVDSRASILDATETRSAVTPPSDTTATVEPPAELSYRTSTIKNETKVVVIQVGPSSMTIIDPATTEAVVCSNEPILSLGEDEVGTTRGVVLGNGTILINPTEFFVKFVRLEGAPFAIDAVAKVCDFFAAHNRLSTPDLMLSMPKLSETSRELVSAKTIVVGGVAFTVATDNSTEKIIRGIVVTKVGTTTADSRTFLKMFPEGNQVAQTITSMAVRGIYPGPFTASLGFRDGTAFQCEFSATTDMTCTAR